MRPKNVFLLALSLSLLVACAPDPVDRTVDGTDEEISQALSGTSWGPPTAWIDAANNRIPANIRVGRIAALGNKHYIMFRRVDTGECDGPWQIGTSSGLSTNVLVLMSNSAHYTQGTANGGDDFIMSPFTEVLSCTSASNGPPGTYSFAAVSTANTKAIGVYGGEAGDWIDCSTTAAGQTVECYGNGGNDAIILQQAYGLTLLDGGNGNDTIRVPSVSDPAKLTLRGKAGDDCLQSYWTPPVGQYDCGAGTGDRSTGVVGSFCEGSVPSCP